MITVEIDYRTLVHPGWAEFLEKGENGPGFSLKGNGRDEVAYHRPNFINKDGPDLPK